MRIKCAHCGCCRNPQSLDQLVTQAAEDAALALMLPNYLGTNGVNVQVRDRAGNVRLAYRSIVLDSVAPTVTLVLNGGAALTGSRTVNLAMTATDANDAAPSAKDVDCILAGSAFSIDRGAIDEREQVRSCSTDLRAQTVAEESWFSALAADRGVQEAILPLRLLGDLVELEALA